MAAVKPMVLLVEDSPDIRRLARTYLDKMGLEVVEVGDAKKAIALMDQRVPDLVLLDLMLPEVSGYDLCEHIRKTPATAEVPVLVVSARTLPTDKANALEVGANAYLTKPFTHGDFSTSVGALLKRRKVDRP